MSGAREALSRCFVSIVTLVFGGGDLFESFSLTATAVSQFITNSYMPLKNQIEKSVVYCGLKKGR